MVGVCVCVGDDNYELSFGIPPSISDVVAQLATRFEIQVSKLKHESANFPGMWVVVPADFVFEGNTVLRAERALEPTLRTAAAATDGSVPSPVNTSRPAPAASKRPRLSDDDHLAGDPDSLDGERSANDDNAQVKVNALRNMYQAKVDAKFKYRSTPHFLAVWVPASSLGVLRAYPSQRSARGAALPRVKGTRKDASVKAHQFKAAKRAQLVSGQQSLTSMLRVDHTRISPKDQSDDQQASEDVVITASVLPSKTQSILPFAPLLLPPVGNPTTGGRVTVMTIAMTMMLLMSMPSLSVRLRRVRLVVMVQVKGLAHLIHLIVLVKGLLQLPKAHPLRWIWLACVGKRLRHQQLCHSVHCPGVP